MREFEHSRCAEVFSGGVHFFPWRLCGQSRPFHFFVSRFSSCPLWSPLFNKHPMELFSNQTLRNPLGWRTFDCAMLTTSKELGRSQRCRSSCTGRTAALFIVPGEKPVQVTAARMPFPIAILAGWIHWRLVRRLVDQHPRGARGLGLPPHVNPKTPDEGNPNSQKWYNPKCIHKNLF